MPSTVKGYWKSLVSTEELLAFARDHNLPLGRTNPRRTLNLYIRMGLLPPRVRTHGRRLNWGFPPYAKALLAHVCQLKAEGRTLAEIKKLIEADVEKSHEAFKKPDHSLHGLEDAYSDPVYDYNYYFCHSHAKFALDCLKEGKLQDATRALRVLVGVLEPPPPGKRVLVIAGSPERGGYPTRKILLDDVPEEGKKAKPQVRKKKKSNV